MISILLDNDIAGHRDLFNGTLGSTGWDAFELVRFLTLEEVGMRNDAPDAELWQFCQQRDFVLLTANRNLDDESSLEQTIRHESTTESLPVITVSAPQRVVEQDYRERCIHAMIEIVLDLENYRGAGRLYIP